jgi:hypothetical protein
MRRAEINFLRYRMMNDKYNEDIKEHLSKEISIK